MPAWELLGIAAAAFAIGLSGAMMPGPVTTVTLANVGKAGAKAGPLVTLGHAIVEVILVLALALGAGRFFADQRVVGTIAIVGALVLVWMGYGMVTEARKSRQSEGANAQAQSAMPRPVLGGMLASLSNPYWYLWWATVGVSSVALVQKFGAWGVAAFFGGHILSDLVWLSLIAFALHHGKRLMSDAVFQWMLGAFGVFLLGFSGVFLYYGVTQFV